MEQGNSGASRAWASLAEKTEPKKGDSGHWYDYPLSYPWWKESTTINDMDWTLL